MTKQEKHFPKIAIIRPFLLLSLRLKQHTASPYRLASENTYFGIAVRDRIALARQDWMKIIQRSV